MMIDDDIYELVYHTDLIKDLCKHLDVNINLLNISIIMDEDKYGMMDELYKMTIIQKDYIFYRYKVNLYLFKCRFMDIHQFVEYVYSLIEEISKELH